MTVKLRIIGCESHFAPPELGHLVGRYYKHPAPPELSGAAVVWRFFVSSCEHRVSAAH